MKQENRPTDTPEKESLPVGFIPMPTSDYRAHRKILKVTVEPGRPRGRATVPAAAEPIPQGPRVLLWKQDPTVAEIGVRKAYLPSVVASGPRDARIRIQGVAAVVKNVLGDFIETPGTDGFDAVHTFTVVRQTLTLYQRALGGSSLPWQWNSTTNVDPLSVFPRAGDTANAYYSRDERALKFFYFTPSGKRTVYTCRSFDIVSHECGHAILDALKPKWLAASAPPQTGGLHESFGDLTAIFLALSQMDQVEAVIAQTKADLHDKTFLADMAEEFGLALGRPNGLRNADNDLTLSEVGNEVHAISQVFTGAIYDILADIFADERQVTKKDDARVLYEAGQYLCSVVLRALIQAPDAAATFADVANKMLQIVAADGKPSSYRTFIRNRFAVREVIDAPVSLMEVKAGAHFAPRVKHAPDDVQDRRTCCGTMQLDEYLGLHDMLHTQAQELKQVIESDAVRAAAEGRYAP